MKKSHFAFFIMLPLLWLSGCSDYPSEGIVDARIIREQATIEEISGAVYGLNDKSIEALENIRKDTITLSKSTQNLWDIVREGNEPPEINLVYGEVDSSAFKKAYKEQASQFKKDLELKKSEYEKEIAEIQSRLDSHKESLASAKEKGQLFDQAIASAEASFEAVNLKLEEAKSAYNKVFESTIAEVTQAAEAHGIKGTYSDTLIGRYRHIDYTNRNQVPETCPEQRGYFSVDVRDVNKQCVYLSVPRNIQGTAAESDVKSILSGKFREYLKAAENLGQKGAFMRKPTGLFAEHKKAEDELNNAKLAAAQQYGNQSQISYAIKNAEYNIEREQKTLKERQSEDYIEKYSPMSRYSATNEYREALSNYASEIRKHASQHHIHKLSEIAQENRDGIIVGSFKEIDSGYKQLFSVTDILVSKGYSKDVIRSVDILSTEDPAVSSSDILTFKISKDSFVDVGRDRSDDRMRADIIKEYIQSHLRD